VLYGSSVNEDELAELLARCCDDAGVVGAIAGVLIDDRATTAAFGLGAVDPDVPITDATRFHIASVTKPMVATVLARVADRVGISFDDRIDEVVPEVRSGDWGKSVTIRHLMANTSGIPERASWDQEYDAEDDDCLARLAAELAEAPPLWEAGSLWGYTNLAWSLLGRVIECLTDLTFEEAMRRELFAPLHMNATRFDLDGDLEPASMGFEMMNGSPVAQAPWHARALGPGGGTLWSTVGDLLRFARVHVEDGALPDGGRYAAAAVLPALRVEHARPGIPEWLDAWCLGMARWDWPGAVAYGWDGIGVGFRANLRLFPDQRAAFVLLTNTSTGRTAYRELLREIVLRVGGGPLPPEHLAPREVDAGELAPFAGVYGIPDKRVVVRTTTKGLLVEGLEGVDMLRPLGGRIFLADPNGADFRTVGFAEPDAEGHPRALYDLVWALPRMSE
jgi:CubicO group peptidase (beta-lactamase class C family)